MFEKLMDIALGSRAGILNRVFTSLMLLMIVLQLYRYVRFRLRLSRWRYRLLLLEQEAREEGVVTAIGPKALPPLDPYVRFWEFVPSMAIMLGLLGTFIGLTLSLSDIPVTVNVDDIRKGLKSAIPSMGTAFWTSLCGLIVAIFVRINNSLMSADFRYKVVDTLMQSEPQVIEALETAAFQQGSDGALLRPHGVRELLWHQNRYLNQTLARLAPQISEGIARAVGNMSGPSGGQGELVGEIRTLIQKLDAWQDQQNHIEKKKEQETQSQKDQLSQLIQQQQHSTQVIAQEVSAVKQRLQGNYGSESPQGFGEQTMADIKALSDDEHWNTK